MDTIHHRFPVFTPSPFSFLFFFVTQQTCVTKQIAKMNGSSPGNWFIHQSDEQNEREKSAATIITSYLCLTRSISSGVVEGALRLALD